MVAILGVAGRGEGRLGFMKEVQPSFTDVEYGMRRRATRRETFLTMMDEVIPWAEWVRLIEPHYYRGERGRRPRAIETMLRMYLLQVWFSLSDEGVEEAIYDSHAMRRFMRLDFSVEQAPDATTLLHFRHLLEQHQLGKALFAAQNRLFEEHGWVMRGGSVIDATLIAAPSSTKNREKARDPEMHQTRKGNQWYFGLKAHIGADAGTGYVHTVTATAANVHDLDQAGALVRDDDRFAYTDAGYQGIEKRADIIADPNLSKVEFRVAARKGILKQMAAHDRAIDEHPFLVVKRDFGLRKIRYRGLAKNLNLLHVAFASANLLMRARAQALMAAA